MKQRNAPKSSVAMSLFPFLAVLMSTMGALLVLLVMVMQKAKLDGAEIVAQRHHKYGEASASQGSEPRESERQESLSNAKDVHDWRRQVLAKQREELQQTLAGRRMVLSHLEDRIRGLERDWRELSEQAAQMEKSGTERQNDQQVTDEELSRVQRELDAAGTKLAEAKEQAQVRSRSFAIVPYQGPNGTRRRPIFIECTDAGIVLQPEGIVLNVTDFMGELGPGNPLDAALRTTREYLMRVGDTKVNGEPYPLLVVRPSGTVAYGVARAAIRAWDDEFGYELVDAEMQLEYPSPDLALRKELDRTIADARQRQAILAAAMPGRFARQKTTGLVATTQGGFQATGETSSFDVPGGMAGGLPSGNGSFTSTFGPATPIKENSPLGTPANFAPTSSAPGTSRPRGAAAQPSGSSAPSHQVVSSHAQSAQGPTRSTSGGGAWGGGPGPAGTGVANPRPGELPSRDPNSVNTGTPAGAGAGAAPTGSRETALPASASQGYASSKARGPRRSAPIGCQPLAATRGENWGLPNQMPTATGFTRSIRIQCLADQLIIWPEAGDYRSPTIVPTPEGISSSIDTFVSAIWKRTESWGIAAEGGYWKPILRVEVGPDAEDRFEELRILLDGSGLPVERK